MRLFLCTEFCSPSRLRVLDCYSDPLGWKNKLMERGNVRNPYEETLLKTSLCKNVKELDKVLSSIVELGKGKALKVLVSLGSRCDLVKSKTDLIRCNYYCRNC